MEEPYKKYVYFGKKDKNDIFIRNNHFVEHMFVPWLSETLEYGNNYADKVGFKKLKLQMNKIGIGVKQKKKMVQITSATTLNLMMISKY